MSQCLRCRQHDPALGLDSDGWCGPCCWEENHIFIPYSGRRPQGDCSADACPECGHPRTGVFLCLYCEGQADRELRKAIECQEWEQHQAERWKRGYKPQEDAFWQRKIASLDEVIQRYGLTPEIVQTATVNPQGWISWPEESP